jgi:GNAT superfamily N-acetyltransferase
VDKYRFRLAAEADFPAILDIARKSFNVAYAGIFDHSEIESLVGASYSPMVLARILDQARKGETYFDVATTNEGRVIGFCVLGSGRTPAQRKLHQRFYSRMDGQLHRLYLDPTYAGKGVGYALVSRGEAFLQERGIFRYSCYVHQRNEIGKGFYLRQGFKHVPSKDRADDWYMEKSLRIRALIG